MSDPAAIPAVTAPIDRLPHGPEFRFLTRVIEVSRDHHGLAEWSLRGDEWFFRGHFPGQPVVPGVLIGEALAQLCGLVGVKGAGEATASIGARLARIELKFTGEVRPPATISLSSQLIRSLDGLTMYEVSAEADGHSVAGGSVILKAKT